MNNYERIKSAFARGIGGAYVPADDTETIEKLKADGYKIVTYPTAPVVKVLNPDVF